ncbi:S-adenosyl-L-methionine-dependent methyltransferase [Lindgomyces ingoldianus]|uniref:S-adenosyl-L-methionine-dependent methyltransferase n=1 Tax=Lindgomyces ingoldianus TaxID=673940 RepID=A0ACB6QG94_9PLEO|nr:S-adenosyl-L-methionine-dependent methyltransferase [Lindgomyces ingoldianus]KAF2466003.1 S-adenosyl-L-methionine-dependent methyltransferase [Lindgomyces ingoldianus]
MSVSEANQNYFDAISDSYDDKPWFAKMNQQVTDFLRSRLDWVGIPFANIGSKTDAETVRLLDYACGPGLMSRIYGPYVTITRGIDISPKMVATFNARAHIAGFSKDKINAVFGDLFASPQPPELSVPEYYNFDLAVVGFGFHHFEDVIHASKCLKERLRPGGVLVISDFLEGGDLRADENGNMILGTEGDHMGVIHYDEHDDHKEHGQGHHHHHHGRSQKGSDNDLAMKHLSKMNASVVVPSFTIEGVTQFFIEAGFVDVGVITMEERVYMAFAGKQLWRTVLFARGRRPFEGEEQQKSEL